MSDPPSPVFHKLAAPSDLVASVARRGSMLVRESRPVPPRRRVRKLVADFSLAGFCIVHLVWCAHIVGLIP
jgi:hypothetical protein